MADEALVLDNGPLLGIEFGIGGTASLGECPLELGEACMHLQKFGSKLCSALRVVVRRHRLFTLGGSLGPARLLVPRRGYVANQERE